MIYQKLPTFTSFLPTQFSPSRWTVVRISSLLLCAWIYYVTKLDHLSLYDNMRDLVPMAKSSNFKGDLIVGKVGAMIYPWQTLNPHYLARFTAWTGYILHQGLQFWVIKNVLAEKKALKSNDELKPWNYKMIAINVTFTLLKLAQSYFYYDGLAIDVPEITPLFSVVLILVMMIILMQPRRGLLLGYSTFSGSSWNNFIQFIKHYHGYICSVGSVYNLWYHPIGSHSGMLAGYYYQFQLLYQTSNFLTKDHTQPRSILILESLVWVHGILTAIFQAPLKPLNWQIFHFGFATVFFLTQIYTLMPSKTSALLRSKIQLNYFLTLPLVMIFFGDLTKWYTTMFIPLTLYGFVLIFFSMYTTGSFLKKGISKLSKLST